MSLADVMAEEAMRPFHLVPGLIDGHATMLAGKSEGGKSTLLSDLAAAALRGTEFLGRQFTSEVRRVVIVAADLGGHGECARRLHERGVSIDNTSEDRCALIPFRHPLPQHWNELAGEIRPRNGDLVIVDPIGFLIPEGGPSINSDEGVRAVWSPLGRWAEAGAAVVVAHHLSNKGQQYEPSAMGNSLFTGAARINLKLGRRTKTAPLRLETSPNSGPAEVLTLEFQPDGLRLVSAGDAAALARERDAVKAKADQAIASRAVAELPGASPAEMGRAIAEWYPHLSTAKRPGREMAKRLSQGRDFGMYMEHQEGSWRLREFVGAS